MPPKPAYLRAESASQNRWLISYTDIMTILLILFVAAGAQSTRNQAIPAAASVARPVSPARETDSALREAEQKLAQQGFDLRREPRGLVISLPQAVLFASADDAVSATALATVSRIAAVLGELNNKVILVGHADAVPIHNRHFKSNWELSAARSLNLLTLLAAQYGIDESRLSIQSNGAYDPKTSNDTAAGRAENRRVDILILDEPPQQAHPR